MNNVVAHQGSAELVFKLEVEGVLTDMATTCKGMPAVYETPQYRKAVSHLLLNAFDKLVERVPDLGKPAGVELKWGLPLVWQRDGRYAMVPWAQRHEWPLLIDLPMQQDEAVIRNFEATTPKAEDAKARQLKYYEGLPK
jgi:hypothetical protein